VRATRGFDGLHSALRVVGSLREPNLRRTATILERLRRLRRSYDF